MTTDIEQKVNKEMYEQAVIQIYEAGLSLIKVKRLLRAAFQYNEDEDSGRLRQVFALVVDEINTVCEAIDVFDGIATGKIEYEVKRLKAVQIANMKVQAYLSIIEKADWINHDRAGAQLILFSLIAVSQKKTAKLLRHFSGLDSGNLLNAA